METCGSPKPKKLQIRNDKSLGADEKSGSPTPNYSRVWQQLPKGKKSHDELIPVDFSRSALSRIAGSRSPKAGVNDPANQNLPTVASDHLQEEITKHNPYNYETAQKKIPLLDLAHIPGQSISLNKNKPHLRHDLCGFHTERLKGSTDQDLGHQRQQSTIQLDQNFMDEVSAASSPTQEGRIYAYEPQRVVHRIDLRSSSGS